MKNNAARRHSTCIYQWLTQTWSILVVVVVVVLVLVKPLIFIAP
jgi:hypothetical protein